MKIFLIVFCLLLEVVPASAQVSFIYDQQSSTNNTANLVPTANFSLGSSIGQSFTPSLASIDFVRLRFYNSGGRQQRSASGTIYVNLWSGGISNGVLLAATAPVFLSLSPLQVPDTTDFFFQESAALNSGGVYYLQPIINPQVGSLTPEIFIPPFNPGTYAGGTLLVNGVVYPQYDLWFREGLIVVPEPASARLLLVTILGLAAIRHKTKPG